MNFKIINLITQFPLDDFKWKMLTKKFYIPSSTTIWFWSFFHLMSFENKYK